MFSFDPRCHGLCGSSAARLAVLIWIKSGALPAAVIEHRPSITAAKCPRVVNGSLTGSEHHRPRPLRSGGHWSSEARCRHRSAPPAPVTAILCRHEMRGTARIEPGARARLAPSPHHVTHLDATTTAAQAGRHHAFAASPGDRRHRPSNFVPIRNATRKNADPNTMGMCRRAVPPLIHAPQRTPAPTSLETVSGASRGITLDRVTIDAVGSRRQARMI